MLKLEMDWTCTCNVTFPFVNVWKSVINEIQALHLIFLVYILFLHKSVDVLTKLNMHHMKDFHALPYPPIF